MGVVGRSEADLDRQVVRVTAWTTTEQVPVDRVMTDAGSALTVAMRGLFGVASL
jgi:predicted site-specific integrase-resolvase